MISKYSTDYSVTYYANKIILRGDSRRIHTEAFKIIERFRYSAMPYYIALDSTQMIELKTRGDTLGKAVAK